MSEILARMPIRILFVVALVLLGGTAIGMKLYVRAQRQHAAEQETARNEKAEQARNRLIPAGFTHAVTLSGIEYGARWTKPAKCPDTPYCYGLDIAVGEDCPTFLAAQIIFAGTTATDVSSSRTSARATKAGQVVRLLFPTRLPAKGPATLETVTCS